MTIPCQKPGAVQEECRWANPEGYNFISRKVLPRLKELGVSDQEIHQIMLGNPRRFFEGS
jgi:predicted metal-dependent phosphotriesterase family hydrolase